MINPIVQQRRRLQQGHRPAPSLGPGPVRSLRRACLLAGPRHLLLRGLPPLPGQRPRPPADRAVTVPVRVVVLQRRGQQPGQRPRPAGRRARDGVQPGRGIPQRRRGIPDIVLGGRRELRQAAKPVEFAPSAAT
jgi:hypothetical protein